MNAKTYLDATASLSKVFTHETRRKAIERLEVLHRFYSQAFSEPLITEVFSMKQEGRTLDGKFRTTYPSFGVGMAFHNIDDGKWHYEGCYGVFIAPPPQTLDCFIYDCLRAGIDLKWTENIEKEYFDTPKV